VRAGYDGEALMTGLLVSVRNAEEARDAVEADADLIDIKEPLAGPLGAAAPETIAEIIRVVAGRRPLSVALGELADQKSTFGDRLPLGIRFAKLGLAGCVGTALRGVPEAELSVGGRSERHRGGSLHSPSPVDRNYRPDGISVPPRRSAFDWTERWRQAIEQFPNGISAVAVIYADFESAAAPPPDEVIAHGRELGCHAMLIDTFDKRGPGLLGHLSIGDIKRLVTSARTANLIVVLGGQITVAHLPDLLPLAPDYIAVRGAVCRGDRAGRLDPDRVRQFLGCLRASTSPTR
jgi:(5-formylfuran-3-yl)methyl phosphate synthase